MRLAIIGFLVVIVCAVAFGKSNKVTQPCEKFCKDDYDPVCTTPKSGKGPDLSFGNECVLEKYNCEHSEAEYVHKGRGECPGATGIRLQ